MPVREVEYNGLTVKAAAFEVVGTGSFIVSLAIVVNAGDGKQERMRLIELPTTDEWFCDVEEALEFASTMAKRSSTAMCPAKAPQIHEAAASCRTGMRA